MRCFNNVVGSFSRPAFLFFIENYFFLTTGAHSVIYEALKYTHQIEKEEFTVSDVTAPMGGKVLDVKVNVGDAVSEGDEVLILEAMKMELPVVSPASGAVKEVKCNKGDAVEAEAVLIVLE